MIWGRWRPSMVSTIRSAARPFLPRDTVGRAWGASETPAERKEGLRVAGSEEGAGAKAMAPPA
jgi:hypothetical protein